MDVWPLIGAERASLVEALDGLPEDAWSRPSLCEGWTNKQVAGHMVATGMMTPGRFFGRLASSGFSFDKMVGKDMAEQTAGRTPQQLVQVLKGQALKRNGPPGPPMAMLGEVIVHGEDIFRPLGGYRQHDVSHLVLVADFYKKSNLIVGAKKRLAGVHLKATDTQWEAGGGPGAREVSGPILPLVMAMTGRKAVLDDLTGDGVAILRQRS
jgi:uncharacterized protein (TIGR03083 family)